MKLPEAPQESSPIWKFWNVGVQGHVGLYKLTRGKLGGSSSGAPTLLLEHVGAKSGKHRTHALTCLEDGDDLVLIASKGGIEKNPAWYHNVMANPDVTIWWKGKKQRAHARKASPAEREELWPKVVDLYRGYAAYQKRTDREIPLVILDRENGAG